MRLDQRGATNAEVVIADLTRNLEQASQLMALEDIERVRLTPDAFMARNAALRGLTDYIGDGRMHRGAWTQLVRGKQVGSYRGPEQAASLMMKSGIRADMIGVLACASYPLRMSCGIGPDQLLDDLQDKNARTRFRARLRRDPTNNHFCGTNLAPARLKKSVA